jgi:hypothetical protein
VEAGQILAVRVGQRLAGKHTGIRKRTPDLPDIATAKGMCGGLALSGDPASHAANSPTSTQQKSSTYNFGEAIILPLPDTGRPPSSEEAIPHHGLHGATHTARRHGQSLAAGALFALSCSPAYVSAKIASNVGNE